MTFEVDALGRLLVTLPDGTKYVGVTPVRCFPYTAPTTLVSLLDASGREVALLADLSSLAAGPRAVLEAELTRREFMPSIQRIVEVSDGAEPSTWRVVTDRGETTFVLPSEDNVRRVGAGAVLADVNGVRFRIGDLGALDARGRRVMQRYL